jgi:hypothetical protein
LDGVLGGAALTVHILETGFVAVYLPGNIDGRVWRALHGHVQGGVTIGTELLVWHFLEFIVEWEAA